jgi:DNA-binding NarL/FixJ family response regulator
LVTKISAKRKRAQDWSEKLRIRNRKLRIKTRGTRFLNLPKKSGIEILERIKVDPRPRNIPVIILTASNRDRHISLPPVGARVEKGVIKRLPIS